MNVLLCGERQSRNCIPQSDRIGRADFQIIRLLKDRTRSDLANVIVKRSPVRALKDLECVIEICQFALLLRPPFPNLIGGLGSMLVGES
jgi:hypothetical protein